MLSLLFNNFKLPLKKYHRNLIHPYIRLSSFSSKTKTKCIRNIGLVAHIDAGKTTTTERMLYYSGFSERIGEVHHGDTVMDFMEQERERGITITMAAATIEWLKHHINIIDTPGHVDFTFEVERSLSVLDGAVIVLDSAAGVQAQTIKIWRQVRRFQIPGLFYLNKMDKPNSSLEKCMKSIEQKLKIDPFLLQLPVKNEEKLIGIIDLVDGSYWQWPSDYSDRIDSNHIEKHNLLSGDINDSHKKYQEEMYNKRESLISKLSDYDEILTDHVLSLEHVHNIDPKILKDSIRKLCLQQQLYPIFLGSSYRNIGIEPLLNAICDYLPEPLETNTNKQLYDYYTKNKQKSTENLCALVFKIHHHQRLGLLTYLRIYSGSLINNMNVYNLNRQIVEKIAKIYRPFADHFQEININNNDHNNVQTSITTGDIIVVSGLRQTITGDTLVHSSYENNNDVDLPILAGIEIPEPVYYCSLECPSVSKFKQLEIALKQLQREDPSLFVDFDNNTQQLIIKGMGELHIEIIKERIRREYGINVETGQLQVSYREMITNSHRETIEQTKMINGHRNNIKITCEVQPKSNLLDKQMDINIGDDHLIEEKNLKRKFDPLSLLKIVNTKENNLSSQIRPWQLKAIGSGIQKALEYGPLFSFPVVGVQIFLYEFEISSSSQILCPLITNVTSHCILQALKKSDPILMEPIMRLEIVTPEQFIGPIISDLTMRRSKILSNNQEKIDDEYEQNNERQLISLTPLSELLNYSTKLRTITSGMATFDLRLHSYRPLSNEQTINVIKSISGIE